MWFLQVFPMTTKLDLPAVYFEYIRYLFILLSAFWMNKHDEIRYKTFILVSYVKYFDGIYSPWISSLDFWGNLRYRLIQEYAFYLLYMSYFDFYTKQWVSSYNSQDIFNKNFCVVEIFTEILWLLCIKILAEWILFICCSHGVSCNISIG